MYLAHDWYMICDRCGGQFRRSDMMEEWTGLWVCKRGCWEPRHPQDFVKVSEDDPSVPVVRPDIPQVQGQSSVIYADIEIYSRTIRIEPILTLSDKDPIGIVLDDGTCHWTFVDGDPTEYDNILYDANGEIVYDANGEIVYTADPSGAGGITLNTPIPYKASIGNIVYLPHLNNESWQ